MKNISEVHDCFGCGVCSIACAKNLINIRLNNDGFYEPYIVELDRCTECGMCLSVCSYNAEDIAITTEKPYSYVAWSKEYAVRRKCSSGGAVLKWVGFY